MDWLRIGTLLGIWLALVGMSGGQVYITYDYVSFCAEYENLTVSDAFLECFLSPSQFVDTIPLYAVMGIAIIAIIGTYKRKSSYILPFITVGVIANISVMPRIIIEIYHTKHFGYGHLIFVTIQGLGICVLVITFKYYKAIKRNKSRNINKNCITFQNLLNNEENT